MMTLDGARSLLAQLPRWVVVGVGAVLVMLGAVLALRPFRSLAVCWSSCWSVR